MIINQEPSYNQYGTGGGKNLNYYKVNRDEGIIVFDEVPLFPIYLEYLSSGITLDEETKIPRRLFDALLAGIMYTIASESMDYPAGKVEQLRQNYNSKMKIVKASERNFTKEEYLDVIYKNAKQSTKR